MTVSFKCLSDKKKRKKKISSAITFWREDSSDSPETHRSPSLDFRLWAQYVEAYSLVPEWKTALQKCKESKNLRISHYGFNPDP